MATTESYNVKQVYNITIFHVAAWYSTSVISEYTHWLSYNIISLSFTPVEGTLECHKCSKKTLIKIKATVDLFKFQEKSISKSSESKRWK